LLLGAATLVAVDAVTTAWLAAVGSFSSHEAVISATENPCFLIQGIGVLE
jgi:hypothetical protein